MTAKLNPRSARCHLQAFQFTDLFIDDLGWNHPERAKPMIIEHGGVSYHAHEISQLSGFRVFEIVTADPDATFPDAKTQQAVWKRIAPHAVENILIFLDAVRTRSVWLWMKRDGTKTHTRRHHYLKGQPGDLFLSKLAALVVDLSELDENGNIPITETARRVRAGLDIEVVTKAFFRDFQEEHAKLLDAIEGIPDPGERRWYASVLLNRLMFIWFLQQKGFLDVDRAKDGNKSYLPEKLAASQKSGKNRFFRHFLRDLFFEGFAKPDGKREPISGIPLGDIPYLNGGLFLPHGIEARIEGDALFSKPYSKIKVPDTVFEDLFALFGRYSWSLNDTPGGDDREINPDVLGYIFEKYINQKEFGAYYTRPEITDYLCEQTIHQLVLDRINAGYESRKKLHESQPKSFPAPHRYDSIEDLLLHATGPVCQTVLQDILPRLSLLDPACGSGAFLVAALKTLLNLYTALIGRCEALAHAPVLQWIEFERKQHKAPAAYWLKKKIVTENLYGVDLMEESTEIAKLRLFLSLVASAEKRDQLEPLPNIEFNLLAGNSLIGLLHVDSAKFDSRSVGVSPTSSKKRLQQARVTLAYEEALGFTTETTAVPTTRESQQAHIATKQASEYARLLDEKNKSIELYKKHGFATGEIEGLEQDERLLNLRNHIEDVRRRGYERLNEILLEEFQALGIQYEQATWDATKKKEGKPEKRPLKIADIHALEPFHWAYEFDEIIVTRGGFDAIITNPPWENFKPDAKEFFQKHSAVVTKNAMRLEDFETEKAEVLSNYPEIKASWLDYLSGFPHVNLYFRNAAQYLNQTAIINGRKATTDLNLYKLFLEQCTHLLAKGARCGIVIPSGIYTDLGATQLRRMLFNHTEITGLFCFENRKAIFEGVHRSFKFVVLSFENGGTTTSFPVSFMRHDVRELQTFPTAGSLHISTELIAKLAPDSLSLLEFHSELDVNLANKFFRWPPFGDLKEDTWNIRLQREFHITDDANLYHPAFTEGMVPLVEGKAIHQFKYPFSKPRYWLHPGEALDSIRAMRLRAIARICKAAEIKADVEPADVKIDSFSYRVAFRDIARNTDERTMLAALIPPGVYCPDTIRLEVVFRDEIRKGKLALNVTSINNSERLAFLAAMNSFALDFQVRQKVTTHVSLFLVYQLPIPRLTAAHPDFLPLAERAARLVGTAPEFDDLLKDVFGKSASHKTHGVTDPQARLTLRAQIDALVARLYDLTTEEFQHILSTFPLVDESVKSQTLNTYRDLLKLGKLPDPRQ